MEVRKSFKDILHQAVMAEMELMCDGCSALTEQQLIEREEILTQYMEWCAVKEAK